VSCARRRRRRKREGKKSKGKEKYLYHHPALGLPSRTWRSHTNTHIAEEE
jgi:hypothetical protein